MIVTIMMIIIIIIIIIIISFQRQRPQDWTGSRNLAFVRRSGVMTAERFFDTGDICTGVRCYTYNDNCSMHFCRDPHIQNCMHKLIR